MKKLLILTAAIGFAFSVNAQQIDVRKNVPTSIEKPSMAKETISMQSVKTPTILNAGVTKTTNDQRTHKSTTDANYTRLGWLSNMTHAIRDFEGKQPSRGNCILLFPDSTVVSNTHDMTGTYSGTSRPSFAFMGFVFDPYSKSNSYYKDLDFFGYSKDTLFGYMIDTLVFYADYRLAGDDGNNYNPNSPDILRFYAWTIDKYDTNVVNLGQEYAYTDSMDFGDSIKGHDFRRVIYPYAQLANPIPVQGPGVVQPTAFTRTTSKFITWDRPLTLDDTAVVEKGYVTQRYMDAVIPNGGFEVPPGSMVAFLVEFIPGYAYNVGDTISKTTMNSTFPAGDPNRYISDSIYLNKFRIWYWDIPETQTGVDEDLAKLYWDAHGYNSSLAVAKGLRYGDKGRSFHFSSLGTYYISPNYYAKPMFYVNLLQSDEMMIKKSDIPDFIVEPNELVSAIYPNPATSQLTIDLKAEGNANVAIYNVLGQALIQENVSDISNTINISNLSQGVYVIKITQNGKVHTVKFSKE